LNDKVSNSRYIAVLVAPNYLSAQLKYYAHSTNKSISAQTFPVNPRLVDSLKEFMTEYEVKAPGYEQLLDAGALKIVHHIIRTVLRLEHGNENICCRMSINKAVEYFHGHYGEKISVQDLSYVANLSSSHFSGLFRHETTMSPAEYMMHTRLDYAKRMLRSNEKSLTEIALDCGFNSSSYFSQCFVRAFASLLQILEKLSLEQDLERF